jgi:hypothetical protein
MCIKGTTTTHIRRRVSRVETEEGVVRGVVRNDSCTASCKGTMDACRLNPHLGSRVEIAHLLQVCNLMSVINA